MKLVTLVLVMAIGVTATAVGMAATDTFDQVPVGKPPANWMCGVTGGGAPQWAIEADASAPSPPNILKQSGSGSFPWCVKADVSIQDGFVEVRFKPVAGREDQAGGLVWRWKAGDNYYVAGANALENNVSLYHTEHGHRITIKYVDAPVASCQGHRGSGSKSLARVSWSFWTAKPISTSMTHISQALATSAYGTKADSVTAFDDFSFGSK